MPSPFPGMNPYLEQRAVWHDFHERFCPTLAELITLQVRPEYFVKIDEHVYIHELPGDDSGFLGRGDVTVASRSGPKGGVAVVDAIDAPMQIRLPGVDEERISFLEVRDRESNEVITVIELLSPSNKLSRPDREQYIAKRSAILQSWVHFVEIDLLRGGPRMPMENLSDCDYAIMVSRYQERPKAGVWPLALRDPLPVIPIPLKAPDADAKLDLRAALDRVYDAAGYEDYLYRTSPDPELSEADTNWARACYA